ncbi:YlmH family RNA-binding protein [Streptococcus merionis]|uniref:S4 domain-containing protein n=1 Tax=Streptococcus merionis TaxID=400065 RepID=A0A239SLE0_9STRE|nr:YlmH/Sll1252 family protein [Streptococcus merionis]SNU86042.1 S4 domain-containing protein [Streptococcus merionis]
MMASKENQFLFQHFHADEKVFVEKMLDRIDRVQQQYSIELTPFLNPREAEITTSLARRAALQVYSSSEILQTELCRLIIAPDYYMLEEEDFEIDLLKIQYARKFNHLTHSQILGNLVNQLGIQRYLLGDIIIAEDCTQLLLDAKISQMLTQQVTKISKVPVSWRKLSFSELVKPAEKSEVKQILTTSLRLDSVIAATYGLSRQEAAKLIEQNKVKLNHQPISQAFQAVKLADLISCRGYGRFKIEDDNGLTRHNKHKLMITKIGGK